MKTTSSQAAGGPERETRDTTTGFEFAPMLLAAFPVAWLGLLYAFVLRARLQLGHWPAPYRPDPKSLGFGLHHQAIWLGLFAVPYIAGAGLALALLGRATGMYRGLWRVLGLLLISLTIFILVLQLDPGNYFEWFAD